MICRCIATVYHNTIYNRLYNLCHNTSNTRHTPTIREPLHFMLLRRKNPVKQVVWSSHISKSVALDDHLNYALIVYLHLLNDFNIIFFLDVFIILHVQFVKYKLIDFHMILKLAWKKNIAKDDNFFVGGADQNTVYLIYTCFVSNCRCSVTQTACVMPTRLILIYNVLTCT